MQTQKRRQKLTLQSVLWFGAFRCGSMCGLHMLCRRLLTRHEDIWLVPVEVAVLHGMVGHPQNGACRQLQVPCQVCVLCTHPQLADPDSWVHAQSLLRHSLKPPLTCRHEQHLMLWVAGAVGW